MVTVLVGLIAFIAGIVLAYIFNSASAKPNQESPNLSNGNYDSSDLNQAQPPDTSKQVLQEVHDLLDLAITTSISEARENTQMEETSLRAAAYNGIRREWQRRLGAESESAKSKIVLGENPYGRSNAAEGVAKSHEPNADTLTSEERMDEELINEERMDEERVEEEQSPEPSPPKEKAEPVEGPDDAEDIGELEEL